MDEDIFAFDSQYQELLNDDIGKEGNFTKYFFKQNLIKI